jgi:hypothetical protein
MLQMQMAFAEMGLVKMEMPLSPMEVKVVLKWAFSYHFRLRRFGHR